MFDFGLRIRELRERRKMIQEELGRRIGRSKPVISSYENNIKIPPLDVLINISAVFNVSLDYLVGIDKNEMISV
ncbi:MAG: helix-turn-helix transcriptional regulator [Firmicutes bacterium]|nr:helix-turn-helix transcriptional regulator [Bacillota bacterium]